MRLVASLMVLLLALAGCTHVPTQCIADNCLADPQSNDARYVLETYGLHQITGDETTEYPIGIEDDLVAWQVSRRSETRDFISDILGYSLSLKQLLPISSSDVYHSTRGHLADGQVVWTQEPKPGAPDHPSPTYLMHWNHNTGIAQKLDIPLGGQKDSFGFDGEWVLFGVRGSQNTSHNALWGYHVGDGSLVKVYEPPPGGILRDGSRESFRGMDVHGSVAYIALDRFQNDTLQDAEIRRVVLTTGDVDTLYEGHLSMVRLVAGERFLAMGASTARTIEGIHVLNLTTLDFYKLATPEEERSSFPAIGGDWVSYAFKRESIVDGGIAMVNVVTGEKRVVNNHQSFVMEQSITDGKTVVVKAAGASSPFENRGWNMYWIPITDIPLA